MITLTENAAAAVKALSHADEPAEGFRITVEASGCAGLKYLMGLESVSRDGMPSWRRTGSKVLVDASSAHLVGMTVEFVRDLEPSGFVFDNPNARDNNPNARDKCACGKSFG